MNQIDLMLGVIVEVHHDHHTPVMLLSELQVVDRMRPRWIRIRYLAVVSSCSLPIGDRRSPHPGIDCNTTEVDGTD